MAISQLLTISLLACLAVARIFPRGWYQIPITYTARGERILPLTRVYPDTRHFGEYAIVNCNENAARIEKMLSFILTASLSATQDAETTPVSPAYRAFFKDPEESILVSGVLVNIAAGKPIHRPSEINDGGPVIVCIRARNELKGLLPTGEHYDAYDVCRSAPWLGVQYMPGSPYIGICPSFWNSGIGTMYGIPREKKCLSLAADKKFFAVDRRGGAGHAITGWGVWGLFYHISEIYLRAEQIKRNALSKSLKDREYDANTVLLQPSRLSAVDPQVYVLYAASQLRLMAKPATSTSDKQK
ncbi:MAG: hypothetical protein Q9174_006257 [Haloplaca sp. 1 TL-2023]